MLCANYSHTCIQSMLCLPCRQVMRGFTVLCMQSSPYFAQGTYVQSMGIHSLRRTIHGLSRSILCARYNPPWIACAIHRLLRNVWNHRLRRTIYRLSQSILCAYLSIYLCIRTSLPPTHAHMICVSNSSAPLCCMKQAKLRRQAA